MQDDVEIPRTFFTIGDGRTKLHELRYARRDWTAYVLGAIMLAGVIVLRQFGL